MGLGSRDPASREAIATEEPCADCSPGRLERIARTLRWIAGVIALLASAWWARQWIGDRRRPRYGVDLETGLQLRIAPLSPAETAAALERESDPTATVRL